MCHYPFLTSLHPYPSLRNAPTPFLSTSQSLPFPSSSPPPTIFHTLIFRPSGSVPRPLPLAYPLYTPSYHAMISCYSDHLHYPSVLVFFLLYPVLLFSHPSSLPLPQYLYHCNPHTSLSTLHSPPSYPPSFYTNPPFVTVPTYTLLPPASGPDWIVRSDRPQALFTGTTVSTG